MTLSDSGKSRSGAAQQNPLLIKTPQLVQIPTGSFIMGTSDVQIGQLLVREDWAKDWYDEGLFQVEQPQHSVKLAAFEIAQYPVTNADYYTFVYRTGHRIPKGWIGFHYPDGQAEHPVTGISWNDAAAYCKWLSEELKSSYRLPTEAEWERAARGVDGNIFPWGDMFDPWRCNTTESGKHSTTPVWTYARTGDSPAGVSDMVGNVWEWTNSLLQPYPYKLDDGREAPTGAGKRVVRGGAWYYSQKLARCAAREGLLPDYTSNSLGFRLGRSS